jgi:hypothetical protein
MAQQAPACCGCCCASLCLQLNVPNYTGCCCDSPHRKLLCEPVLPAYAGSWQLAAAAPAYAAYAAGFW